MASEGEKQRKAYILLLLVLMVQAQAHIQGSLVKIGGQLVSSSINLYTPGVQCAGGSMVCSARNVLQTHKAGPEQAIQQLLCVLQAQHYIYSTQLPCHWSYHQGIA